MTLSRPRTETPQHDAASAATTRHGLCRSLNHDWRRRFDSFPGSHRPAAGGLVQCGGRARRASVASTSEPVNAYGLGRQTERAWQSLQPPFWSAFVTAGGCGPGRRGSRWSCSSEFPPAGPGQDRAGRLPRPGTARLVRPGRGAGNGRDLHPRHGMHGVPAVVHGPVADGGWRIDPPGADLAASTVRTALSRWGSVALVTDCQLRCISRNVRVMASSTHALLAEYHWHKTVFD